FLDSPRRFFQEPDTPIAQLDDIIGSILELKRDSKFDRQSQQQLSPNFFFLSYPINLQTEKE
ncbi:MAG: hypothetical protein PVG87_19705, partial [Desulfobacteraceae bacterium]